MTHLPSSTLAPEAPTWAQRWQQTRPFIYAVSGIVLILFLSWYFYDAITHEETDDAYITGHLHYVSSRVAGVVSSVSVEDNQLVQAGDVLVQLDPTDSQVMLAAAKATLGKAEADLSRQQPLLLQNAVTAQQIDAAVQSRDVDKAAMLYAELQVKYATIPAPATGQVARKNVEVGNRVQAGQTLLVIVEPAVWVIANFKETQLAHIRAGQAVEIRVDRIPSHVFSGRVNSFAPGSGNQFALLPADNSTGNFTKIVQRIPVKITLDANELHPFAGQIVPGMSVVAKVSLK